MGRKKVKWKVGDIVGIPRLDGVFTVAQVVDITPQALNSAVLAIFDEAISDVASPQSISMSPERLMAVVFTTREQLDSGTWKILGEGPVTIRETLIPSKELRPRGFVGAKIYGSAIVDNFVNAYQALSPWDMYFRPDYFDDMLISPARKPERLIYKDK
jgi:hypothetical protein